jgi:uncharacterized membrane protein
MSAPYEASGTPPGAPGGKTSLGLDSNVGAMLCYIANFVCCLGVILSVVFLVTEKEDRFVKFHAVQSLLLVGAAVVLGIVVTILGMVLRLALGMADLALLSVFVILGLRVILFAIFAVIWIVAGIKAYGKQWYKLPFIGDLASNMVNK